MTITFVSNYLTLHQIPFCEAMYNKIGDDFRFVNTELMESERISMGWGNDKVFPFEIDLKLAGNLINDSDIVIMGSANDSLIQSRIKQNRPVIRYSERILKNGRWHVFSPRAIKNMYKAHTQFTNKKVWLLCASAYAAGDYGLFGAYWGKCYKWGYFPRTTYFSENQLLEKKNSITVNILWCGRMLNWKHPELAAFVAKHLNEKNIKFHMDIIGDGELKDDIKSQIINQQTENNVSLHGFLTPYQVRSFMERADIFIFTSDFHEGWGAVLNEAMNSGCACVVSHAIGAAPYLINDGYNGFLYKQGNSNELCNIVESLVENTSLRRSVGLNAYHTIADIWNADIAAERLIAFCKAIIDHKKVPDYKSGPMSKARYLSNHWYH